MRRWFCVLFIVCLAVSLQSAVIYQENFSGASTLDSLGWTSYNSASGVGWSISNTNYASGTSPEVRYSRSSSESATARLSSPKIPVNVTDEVIISFKDYLSYMSWGHNLSLDMETKYDGGAWVSRWHQYTTSSSGAHSITLSMADVDTLRVRFVLSGYNENACHWSIDNIKVREGDIHITDEVWTITEDTVINSDQTLYVTGASQIHFTGPYTLTIEGGVEMTGTDDTPISIDMDVNSLNEGGQIVLENPSRTCSFTHCQFINGENTRAGSTMYGGGCIYASLATDLAFNDCKFQTMRTDFQGGGLFITDSSVEFVDCTFNNCIALNEGGAIYAENSTITIDNSEIKGCRTFNYRGGGMYVSFCDIDISNSLIRNCSGSTSYNGTVAYFATSDVDMEYVEIFHCGHLIPSKSTLQFAPDVVANLDHVTIADCIDTTRGTFTLAGNAEVYITNSIIWNDADAYIFWLSSDSNLEVEYSDYRGQVNTSGSFVETSNISLNPEFANLGAGNLSLTENSPCIDAGNPSFRPLDPDYSMTDQGRYPYYQAKPAISNLTDIPDDQGRQLQCVWRACTYDSTYTQAQYYVWREDEVFDRDEAIFITSCGQLAELADAQPEAPVYLMRDDVVWCWVATVPALCRDFYSCVVPTLQDSCAAGSNATTCMITYADANGFWDSSPVSAYSLDNIPPMTPEQTELTRTGDAFTLSWAEVTDGELNGNSYPEQNGVWYRVYAGDSPDFICDETTLLTVTQNLSHIFSNDAERMYFKVVAADQE